ncbi:MAG: SPOR domain-containing protein [Methylococcales bacterium]|nr:SPOR domain-containing protein [Methylococcales bacterium]
MKMTFRPKFTHQSMSSTMTDSTDEKPTSRQNRLSPQSENFDFELAEIQVLPDNINLAPSPIAHFSDDEVTEHPTISGDKTKKPSAENTIAANGFVANESILQPTQTISDIKTSFYVDYFDKRKQRKTTKPEPVLAAETEKLSTVDRSQDTMTLEKTFTTPNEQIHSDTIDVEPPVDNQAPIVNGAGMAVAALSQFKSKQESINKQQEQLIQDFSEKIKKVTYTAVFFGVAALVAATTLGVMLLKTKSEVSDLAGTTTTLEDNMKHIAKVPSDDLEGTDPSIDQLNGVVEQLKQQSEASSDDLHNEIAVLQNKISHLEKTAGIKIAANTNKLPETVHNPQPIVAAIAVEKKPAHEVAVKTLPATKAVKNTSAEQSEPVAVATAKPQTTSKTANKNTTATAKKESEIDKAIAVPANDINNVMNATNPQASSNANPQPTTISNPPSSTNKAQANSGWTVNLASSNQLADAKKSAASYAQKGIPVTITPFTVKNQTRYRLQVKGFKNKDEATAYAKKAKDTLKLDSVWINP